MTDFFTCQLEDICTRLIPKTINGIRLVYAVNVITYTELDVNTNKPIHYVEVTIDITHKYRSLLNIGLFDRRIGYCTELYKLSDAREMKRVKAKLSREIKNQISDIIQILNIDYPNS